jgi:ATP-binding cassette subfamily B (MDR/TAP) protein 1
LLRNPRLLLLDEATSSLDSEAEALVQAAFEHAAKKRNMTMVVVAHRLATVQNADVIFVLGESGAVVEVGSHAELVSRGGVYWNMVSENLALFLASSSSLSQFRDDRGTNTRC